jgi:hypothetical protein
MQTGRLRSGALLFADKHDPAAAVGEMERLHDLGALMRSHPDYEAPEAVVAAVRNAIASGAFSVLE